MTTNRESISAGEVQSSITETAIRLGVLALLLIWCFQILQPFILPVLWGIIIAVALHPIYYKLVNILGGRHNIAAVLITIVFLALLLAPTIMLTKLLVDNVVTLAHEVRSEQLAIPLPPDSVKEWPLVGEPVSRIWTLAATNIVEVLKLVQPQLKALGGWLLELAASTGIGMLMFVLAVVISGVMLAHSASSYQLVHGIARRLAGERGNALADLAENTIRSVTRGVLGVAVIQALLAGLGFMLAGVPGAGIWALLCLILATVQIGVGPIVIPTIIYVFATGDTVTAVVFLIWNVFIMVLDNILKPLLLGRGVDVPMLVIFMGAIGGLLLLGIVGLFLGAVVLALGYKLFQGWLDMKSPLQDNSAG